MDDDAKESDDDNGHSLKDEDKEDGRIEIGGV